MIKRTVMEVGGIFILLAVGNFFARGTRNAEGKSITLAEANRTDRNWSFSAKNEDPANLVYPSPSPTPGPALELGIEEQLMDLDKKNAKLFIDLYAQEYRVDSNKLVNIARCESNLNPTASNGPYLGLFQYSPETWNQERHKMGLDPNPDLRSDSQEAARTAAFSLAQGNGSLWRYCGNR